MATSTTSQPERFEPTHWSVILTAVANERSDSGQGALNELCSIYWRPLYFYLRRQGYGEQDAQDLTQGFFHHLLTSDFLKKADPNRGKFRSFLLSSLNHFVANHWARENAKKRGGDFNLIPLDFASAETTYKYEPATNSSPETLFDRKWALTVLAQALARLQSEYESQDKAGQFEILKESLTGRSETAPYCQIAEKLGSSEGAVKVAIHRLRQRYREVLRAEIARTLLNPGEAETEMRQLFQALAN